LGDGDFYIAMAGGVIRVFARTTSDIKHWSVRFVPSSIMPNQSFHIAVSLKLQSTLALDSPSTRNKQCLVFWQACFGDSC